jgi:hypothetical protein
MSSPTATALFQFLASVAAGMAVWAITNYPEAAPFFTALAVGWGIGAIKV